MLGRFKTHGAVGAATAAIALASTQGLAAPAHSFPLKIYVRNLSSFVSNREAANAMPAFQAAQSKDFFPAWGVNAKLIFLGSDPAPRGAWVVTLLDRSDVQGALAYHETTNGVPDAKIFVGTSRYYGYAWTVGFTHELWEMEADPALVRSEQDTRGTFWAAENADPVESDGDGYVRPGANGKPVQISDFILESWFGSGTTNGYYDFCHHLSAPQQVDRGGYAQFWNGAGWQVVSNWRGHSRGSRGSAYYDIPSLFGHSRS